MKGFRQAPEASRKERLRSMEVQIKNLEMSTRISQMMVQQLMQNLQNATQDLGKSLGLINEMQYKLLAVQKVANLDVTQLNEIANVMRLKDFDEASAKEDVAENFTVGDIVDENSTVILTSKTEDTDRGIFRSRIKLSDCGVPDLIKAFMGRPVGARALVNLNGIEHEVELLGVRQPPAAQPVPQATDGSEPGLASPADEAGAAPQGV